MGLDPITATAIFATTAAVGSTVYGIQQAKKAGQAIDALNSASPVILGSSAPPGANSIEVQTARRDAARAAARRMGLKKTVLAGEGAGEYKTPLGPPTLLNGGVAVPGEKKTTLSGTT